MIHCTECHRPLPELPKHLEKPGISFRCSACIAQQAEKEIQKAPKRPTRTRTQR